MARIAENSGTLCRSCFEASLVPSKYLCADLEAIFATVAQRPVQAQVHHFGGPGRRHTVEGCDIFAHHFVGKRNAKKAAATATGEGGNGWGVSTLVTTRTTRGPGS